MNQTDRSDGKYPEVDVAAKRPTKEERKSQIIQAAADVFAKNGYNKALMADIAVQAGIGKGTLYEYFKSKEDLFFAVYESIAQMMADMAQVNIGGLTGGPGKRLSALSDAVLAQWREVMGFFSLVMEFWSATASGSPAVQERLKRSFKDMYAEFKVIVAGLIREGMVSGEFRDDVDPEAAASYLVGSYDALFLQAWFDDSFDPYETNKKFMPILMRGFSPDAGTAGKKQAARMKRSNQP